MFSKSRLALIGLSVSLVVVAAWLVRSRSVSAPIQAQSAVPVTASATTAAPVAPEAAPDPARESSAPSTAPVAASSTPAARPLTFGEHGPVKLEDVPEGRFRRELAALTPAAREQALAQLGKLRVPLNDVASLQVDRDGVLFYHCPAPTPEQLASALPDTPAAPDSKSAAAGKVPQAAAVPISSPPIRHSRPGASKVIYLDFDGHTITGTAWNEQKGSVGEEGYRPAVSTYVAKPFDTDGDATMFSDTEQTTILAIWGRMAEDYAPFDVDVTTELPASFNSNTGRVVFTPDIDANNVALPSSATAGGVAYLDTFGRFNYVSRYSPAFVYIDSFNGQGPPMAVAASHEMGHNMGLSHDGTTSEEYYEGHEGGGVQAWGPLMGAPYNMTITQWSKGEYYDANNTEDDLAIISGKLGYRPDDHADSNGAATALNVSGGTLSGAGVIGMTGEADRFSFTTGAGTVQFNVEGRPLPGSYYGTDLDVALELYDSTGALVAQADDSSVVIQSLSANVAGGTYYLRVKPVGAGTPQANPPSGYTVYGSLGAYEISGTLSAGAAPQFTQHPSSTSVTAGQSAGFSAQASNATGYRWQRLPVAGGDWSDLSDGGGYGGTATTSLSITGTTVAMNGDQFRLVATNANGSATSNPATLSVSAPTPPSISANPVSKHVIEGASASFTVSASGSAPFSYRWQRQPAGSGVWSDVSGAGYAGSDTSTLTISSASLAMNGDSFRCEVSNAAGSVTSSAATLTVEQLFSPTISGLPTTLLVPYGGYVYLSPVVSGTYPITFQWYRDGVALTFATQSTLFTGGVSGTYTLHATNAGGTAISSPVQVTVAAPEAVVITQQPISLEVASGVRAFFSVSVSGATPVSFQWYRNGLPLANGSGGTPFYILSNIYYSIENPTPADSGEYTVTLTNVAGSVTSAPATLTVLPPQAPKITDWTTASTIYQDDNSMWLHARATGSQPMSYQWFKDGVPLPDGTNYEYNYSDPSPNPSHAGVYSLRVSNAAGVTVSPDWVVTVLSERDVPEIQAARLGDVVFFLMTSPGRILRYDLAHELWLVPVDLTPGKTPTAFLPTAEGCFITYGNELMRRAPDLTGETLVATTLYSIGALFGAGEWVYFQNGDYELQVRNRATLAGGPDPATNSRANYRGSPPPAYSPQSGQLFATTINGSPADVVRFTVTTDGQLTDVIDSPYHGEFGIGAGVAVSPDGTYAISRAGVIYSSQDLRYRGSLGLPWNDLVFLEDGSLIAMRGRKLSRHSGEGKVETGQYFLSAKGSRLFRYGTKLFIFGGASSAGGNPALQTVAMADFTVPSAIVPTDPVGRRISIDDMFLDAGKVINIVSRTETGVVRWDTGARKFLATQPLRGRPAFTSYAPAVDRLVIAYSDGQLAELFPTSDPVERAFANFPASNNSADMIAMDDMQALLLGRNGSDKLGFFMGPSGEVALRSRSGDWPRLSLWLSPLRRLYTVRVDGSSIGDANYDDVPENGQVGYFPQGSGSNLTLALRPNSEGSLLLAMNGRVFNPDLQPAGMLSNPVTDGAWLSDGIYTIRARPDGTQLQKWSIGTYQLQGQLTLTGVPQRIFRLDGSRLAVVTTVDGYLTFHLISDTLAKIATISNDPSFPPDRPVLFNGDAYLANNPDVAAVIGNPPDRADQAWAHYWRFGLAEGRTDGDFNAQAYLAQYPNLAAQFGTNLQAAALHWYTVGRKDGLRIPAGFDVNGYLARNLDIAALFSQDKYGAWLHYYNYGLFEGRSFDANFIPAEYLELNTDVKAVFGPNWQAAVMHWFNYGHPIEDRMGRVPIGFNVDSYLARYPDLAAVFGGITPTAVRNVTVWHHYLAYGTLEGRSDGDFEANHYLNTNPDLVAVVGHDLQAAALHWYFYGRREGRRIPGGFNVQNYRSLYPDVVLVFGDDLYGSWIHYRDNGVFEGRVYDDLFRPADYLSLNPDVATAIGTNYRDALLHWLYYGQYEGRHAKN